MSLKTEMLSKCYDLGNDRKNKNNNTRSSISKNVDRFIAWNKENGHYTRKELLNSQDKAQEAVQAYCDYLKNSGKYKAGTIHTYITWPAKGLGVPLANIDKPIRHSHETTKGRQANNNKQGKNQAEQARFSRLITLQKATGLRRAELAKLTVLDLATDENGYLCVIVRQGKGGKTQFQRLLPGTSEAVKAVFNDPKGTSGHIFAKEEMGNVIDLHALRREQARTAYDYYSQKIAQEPGYRQKLQKELLDRFKADRGENDRAYERFAQSVANVNPIFLRGESKKAAEQSGRPTKYDRTAVLAASVFHLSHWRTDVTISHYLAH